MCLEHEARRRQCRQVAWAPAYFENLGAVPALKVVVVTTASAFVTGKISGQLDHVQPARADQCVDGTIHSCDAEPAYQLTPRLKYFKGVKGLRRCLKYITNRIPLSRVSFHQQRV